MSCYKDQINLCICFLMRDKFHEIEQSNILHDAMKSTDQIWCFVNLMQIS